LKTKILLSVMAITLFAVSFITPVKAVASISIYGYLDKTQYMPGEKGTLKIWVYNDGTEDIILKTITIKYPWHFLYIWEGNETIRDINVAVSKGGNWSTSRTFTVPTDGRAVDGNIIINAVATTTEDTATININVANGQDYSTLKDMEQLVTLFTVLVVLMIVCTAIIAATIFLSARRPQVTWKTEEKP